MKAILYIFYLLLCSNIALAQSRGADVVSVTAGKEANINISAIKNIALVIGTDKYNAKEEWGNLTNPVFDAETIAQVLESDYGYDVTLLRNPTADEILGSLEHLQQLFEKEKLSNNANLMIFIAGHGGWDNFGSGYIVPSDAQSHNQDKYRKTYITHSNLRQVIENINAPHTLLLLDACFGGTFDQKLSVSTHRGEEVDDIKIDYVELLNRKMNLHAVKYITSGGKEYVPDGKANHHSPFAAEVITLLRNNYEKKQPISFHHLCSSLEMLTPEPRAGDFGTNDPGSDFILLPKSLYLDVNAGTTQPAVSIELLGTPALGNLIVRTECLFVGLKNLIVVKHPGISLKNFLVEVSDSNRITPVYPDSNIYSVAIEKPGAVTVVVSTKSEKGEKVVLSKKTFSCKRVANPEMKFMNKNGGDISIEKFLEGELYAEDFNGIRGLFQVTDFTLSISISGEPKQKFESANYELTEEMKNAITAIKGSGAEVKFENIHAVGPDGYRRQMNAMSFTVQ